MTIKQVGDEIKKAKSIAIFAHKNPDPDACGSIFGLSCFCEALNKNAVVFLKNQKESYLDKIFPLSKAQELYVAKDFDLAIVVDCHQISRTEEIFQVQLHSAKKLLIIDHHKIMEDEQLETKKAYIKTEASCSELVLDLFKAENLIPSVDASTYLYAGLMGDTGRFLHSNLSKKVFETAMFLQENGANIQKVYDFMFRYRTKESVKLSTLVYKNIKYVSNGAFCVVTARDRNKIGATIDDVKSFCNELVKIKDVLVSCLCIEYGKKDFKFSWRCKEGLNVFDFCQKHGGGGHICAAGCEMKISKRKLEKMLPVWINEVLDGGQI